MQFLTRAVLRAASIASRPVLSSPKSSTRLLSTKALRPSPPLVSSFALQRRFNTGDAQKEAAAGEAADQLVENAEVEQQSSINRTYTGRPSSLANERSGSASVGWQVEPNNSVYVGNLFFDAKEDDIRDYFSKFGEITKVNLVTDARGYSKGFCFVQFDAMNAAAQAVQEAHGQTFAGRRIAVNFAANRRKVERPPTVPSSTLFIGNLSYDITDAQLNELFRPLSNIRDVRVAIDRRTGQPRGFAHADFADIESATAAKAQLDGKEICGRYLKADFGGGNRTRSAHAEESA